MRTTSRDARTVAVDTAVLIAAARSLGARLVTEDTKLRRAAPALTQSLAQAAGGT